MADFLGEMGEGVGGGTGGAFANKFLDIGLRLPPLFLMDQILLFDLSSNLFFTAASSLSSSSSSSSSSSLSHSERNSQGIKFIDLKENWEKFYPNYNESLKGGGGMGEDLALSTDWMTSLSYILPYLINFSLCCFTFTSLPY